MVKILAVLPKPARRFPRVVMKGIIMQIEKRELRNRLFTVAGLTCISGSALAAPPDLTTLTAAVDFSTVTTAVLGVAAALIVVYIAWKGAKMVIAAVRGG